MSYVLLVTSVFKFLLSRHTFASGHISVFSLLTLVLTLLSVNRLLCFPTTPTSESYTGTRLLSESIFP